MKGSLEEVAQNCNNLFFFGVPDLYCSFLLFSELSNAAVLFVQVTILVLSVTFSLLFLGE